MGCGTSAYDRDPVSMAIDDARRQGRIKRADLDRMWDYADADKSQTLDKAEFSNLVNEAVKVQFNRLKRVFNDARSTLERDIKTKNVAAAEAALKRQSLAARLKNIESLVEKNIAQLKAGKSSVVEEIRAKIDGNSDGLVDKKEFCNPAIKKMMWEASGIDKAITDSRNTPGLIKNPKSKTSRVQAYAP